MLGADRGGIPPHGSAAASPKKGELQLAPGDYKVMPGAAGERWTVTSLKTGEPVCNGIGPLEIRRAATAS